VSTSDLAGWDVKFDRRAPDRVWAAGDSGLSMSEDGGLHWAPGLSWPASGEAWSLALDGDGKRLYLGTWHGVVTLQLPRQARRHLSPGGLSVSVRPDVIDP
jgi:hypothetical protein